MRKGREFPVPHPASVLYPVPFPPVESVKLRSLKSRPSEGYHVNSKTVSSGLRLCPCVRGVQGSTRSVAPLKCSISPYLAQGLLVCGWHREWPQAVLSGSIVPPTGSSPSPNQFSQSWVLGLNRSPGSAQGRRDWTPVETALFTMC